MPIGLILLLPSWDTLVIRVPIEHIKNNNYKRPGGNIAFISGSVLAAMEIDCTQIRYVLLFAPRNAFVWIDT